MKLLTPSKRKPLGQAGLVVITLGALIVLGLLALLALMILRGQAMLPGTARSGAPAPTSWPTLAVQAQSVGTDAPAAAGSTALPGSPPPAEPQSYTVRPNDTLTSIAAQFSVPLDALLEANGFALDTIIQPGQNITIPAVIETATPASGTPAPIDTPPPVSDNPLGAWSIDALASYPYDGGELHKDYLYARNSAYEVWSVSYLSDGLRVTGLVHIPLGQSGPFPVILLLHGGVDQSVYEQGDDTTIHADVFARRGYLTFAPDYRSYNDTEGSGSPLKLPWVIDAMNALDALSTLPEADTSRIGVFGHSRGGGIASYLMVVAPQVDAVILYAPLHTDQAVVWDIYANQFGAEWPHDDGAQVGTPQTNVEGYRIVSPYYYLDRVAMPVQIHHGGWDSVLPVAWSQDLSAQLQAIGKTVEYYEYSQAAHTFYGADFDLMMERSLTFFDTYVK